MHQMRGATPAVAAAKAGQGKSGWRGLADFFDQGAFIATGDGSHIYAAGLRGQVVDMPVQFFVLAQMAFASGADAARSPRRPCIGVTPWFKTLSHETNQ